MKNPYLIARQLLAFLKDELQEGEREEVARMIAGERELTGLVEELKDKEKIRRELERIASFDTEKALRKITRQNGMLVGRRLYRGWKIAAGIVILIGVSATCWLWSGRRTKSIWLRNNLWEREWSPGKILRVKCMPWILYRQP